MATNELILRILEVTVWPLVAVLAIHVVKPHLYAILSGAKIKISIAGQSIETTMREIQDIVYVQTVEPLNAEQLNYLEMRQREGPDLDTTSFGDRAKQAVVRPLRNQGLILTSPRNEYLSSATAIEISGLGRLYLRARSTTN
jgi:hypothetical protein